MVNHETSSHWQSYPLGEIADMQLGQKSITPDRMVQAHGTVPLILPENLNNRKEVAENTYTTWEWLQKRGYRIRF